METNNIKKSGTGSNKGIGVNKKYWYIIKKVILAKSVTDALGKEKNSKIIEVSEGEEFIDEDKAIGFEKKDDKN